MFNCSLGDFMKKDFMKIKANSDVNLPLNKRLKLYNMTIFVRSAFKENNKCYPQIFLGKCLYEL